MEPWYPLSILGNLMAKYILFDTETTGASEEDRIIQVGALIIHSRENIEVFDALCSSEVPIKIEAMEVHNITPNMLENQAPYASLSFAQELEKYNQKENYLIAHNISFDLAMVQKEGFVNHYTLIDTLRCAKHLLPDLAYHRLQYLRYALELYKTEEKEAEALGVSIKAHDAIGDVLVMKLLLSVLVQKAKAQFPSSNPMVKLAELTQTPVLLKTFKFGKYKDREIEEIVKADQGYIQWMQKNMELDEDLAHTLTYYLA